MDTPSRAAASPAPRRGFTLLEMLVVVVIISILTTIGVLSVGVLGNDRQIESEVEHLTDVTAAAFEQAGLEGRDYGLWLHPDGYEIVVYAPRRARWERLGEERLFALHPMPAGLSLALEVEGRPVALNAAGEEALPTPQVVLYASGEASAYRLRVTREGTPPGYLLDGQADGTIRINKPADAP